MGERRQVAVIGGGISGLAAAHRVGELQPSVEVILLEASSCLGGVLQTKTHDGFLIEYGADNFITNVPWGVDFCRRIGFDRELIETNPSHRRAFVVRKGRLHPIPSGFVVMAPSRLWPVATTPILSPLGKLRLAYEAFVPRRQSDVDESLASFVRRRLGRETYERLVQPLVAGIYTADPEKLSLAATMPRFLEMEREHGSLTRAMVRQVKNRRKSAETSGGARYSQFVAPRGGMSTLVQAIADRLSQATILLDSPVQQIRPTDDRHWMLNVGGPQPRQMEVDGIILATPAHHSAQLLDDVDTTLAADLATIEYGGCALVSFAFDREQIGHPLDGFGFVVPKVERRKILSTSFTSIKYEGRAPEGQVLLRVFVGGACQSELLELSDDQLLDLARRELVELLAIQGQPRFRHVTRRMRSMPQYYVGHPSLVQRIISRADDLPNFALASNALYGVGIPNCIQSGELAAQNLMSRLFQPARGCSGVA